MDIKQRTGDKYNRQARLGRLPAITIEEEDASTMEDTKPSNTCDDKDLFSMSKSQTIKEDTLKDNVSVDKYMNDINIGSTRDLDVADKRSLDTLSAGTGSQPSSRKVSFYTDNQSGTGPANSTEYLHPQYTCIPFAANSRKVSAASHGFYCDAPPSRKTSMEAFYYPTPMPMHRISQIQHGNLQHGKISVFSIGNASDCSTIQGDMLEALPSIDNYRDFDIRQRPTLYQLRENDKLSEPMSPTSLQSDLFADELYDDPDVEKGSTDNVTGMGLKFGWIQGVLVRCLLNIFGVMLFLRLTWITGQAGIGLATVIVALASIVTSITTMSMSAICTNGEVKGGGAYYMISRSLGPEFGGSIGIVFSLANAIGAAMYIVGFAETVRDIMWENGAYITGDSLNEVRIIGIGTCFLCLGIILIGMEWEAKAQLGLLVILVAAIINFFIGTFIPPDDDKKWKGVVGYNSQTFSQNFVPHFTEGNSFFSVFSIFFPAATGVLAGANISGDLKNPQTAIPKGTFLAILLTSLVYIAMAWSAGGCMVTEAIGTVASTLLVNPITNVTISADLAAVQDCSRFNTSCESGLVIDIGMVGVASAWRPLILAGIFSATLSSALASMMGAPKVFQALAKDKLFPHIHVFAKGYGASDEPRRAYILCFVICIAMVCVGSLDVIAPIISNFFLMAYAMINFSCFDASIADSPGFRPGFKFYNKWMSLLGSLLCIAVMFLINWWAALVTYIIFAGLYFYVKKSKPDVNWGSSAQANVYREALKSSLRLVGVDEHVKNFRPQILVLTGYPRNRANLVDFASVITKKQSLLICGHVFQGDMAEHLNRIRSMSAYRWLAGRKVKAFYNNVCAPTFRIGVQVLLQALGVGKLRPNTLMLGYKCDWQKSDPRDVFDYYNVIQDAFDLNYGVGILRVPGGLDRNKVPDYLLDLDEATMYESEDEFEDIDKSSGEKTKGADLKATEPKQRKSAVNINGNDIRLQRLNTLEEGMENMAYEADPNGAKIEKPELKAEISLSHDPLCRMFREKQYGTIDVWWMYDDGGLTLLIPYILSQRKQWKNCKLRVFCIGTKKGDATEDQQRMASLLAKFRIEYEQLTVVTEFNKKPQLSTYREFESLIHKWRLKPGEFQEEYLWKIADADLIEHKQKTYRHLRIREKLIEHSKDATLIVMTLPIPRKSMCPAGLYMGWLEILTKGMPPILLLRGNQQSVLTYYS